LLNYRVFFINFYFPADKPEGKSGCESDWKKTHFDTVYQAIKWKVLNPKSRKSSSIHRKRKDGSSIGGRFGDIKTFSSSSYGGI
jgi:hypothetical protein